MQVSTQMGPFSIVPEWVLNKPLSPTALKLYCVLARYADYETGMAFPSRDTLAQRMGCSGKTIDRAVTELVAMGCVLKFSRGRYQSAQYKVLQLDPNGTDLSEFETDVSSEGTDLSKREDKDDTITITTELEPLERKPLNDIDSQFDQFWDIYPLKKDKPSGRRAFKSAMKRATIETILEGAQRYRDDPNRDPKYTKNPSTWLNNDAWENAPEPAPTVKLANWQKAALLAQKYRQEAAAKEIEYENKKVARELEAEVSTWLKGVDDE